MTDENRDRKRAGSNQLMIAELSRFATFKELRRSDVYRKYKAELDRLFREPKI
ncbi:MAG: hypothetical protein L0229_17365 [Blastocatellia bacterium]|nr:hypothetical protein [Blastocatellia bacterium]